MAFVMRNKFLLILGILGAIVDANFVSASIENVSGVDYLPQHYNGYYDDTNKNLLISDNDIENDFSVMIFPFISRILATASTEFFSSMEI